MLTYIEKIEAILASGYSQSRLASLIGVSQGNLSRYISKDPTKSRKCENVYVCQKIDKLYKKAKRKKRD